MRAFWQKRIWSSKAACLLISVFFVVVFAIGVEFLPGFGLHLSKVPVSAVVGTIFWSRMVWISDMSAFSKIMILLFTLPMLGFWILLVSFLTTPMIRLNPDF